MGKRIALLLFAVLSLRALPSAASSSLENPTRERLGAHIGYVASIGNLHDKYGDGYDFVLYFTECLIRTLDLHIQIGATYMGDLLDAELAERLSLLEGTTTEIRFAYLSLGPQYRWLLDDTKTLHGAFGMGIYSVTILQDTGLEAFDVSDQHFGMNGGVGFLWRLTENWSAEVSLIAHWVGTDSNSYLYTFTDGGTNPSLFSLGVGAAFDLR